MDKVLRRRIQGRRLVYSFIISVFLAFVPMNIEPSELVLTGGKIYQPKEKNNHYGKRNQLTRQQKLHQGNSWIRYFKHKFKSNKISYVSNYELFKNNKKELIIACLVK